MPARDAFIDALSRLVADGLLAEADALTLLQRFDAGTLDAGWLAGLPAPPAVAVRGADDALLAAALMGLLATLGKRKKAAPALVSATGALPLAPSAAGFRGARVLGGLQNDFRLAARGLAAELTAGQLTVGEWQGFMGNLLRESMTQASLLGSGRAQLSPVQAARLDAELRRQGAYLSRFADEAFLRGGFGVPMSEAYVANRAGLYGNALRGLFYQGAAEEVAGSHGPGWVVHYIHRDDGRVCPRCLDNGGYYLPTQVYPIPGMNCYGHCRCTLRMAYDLDRYARLMRGELRVR